YLYGEDGVFFFDGFPAGQALDDDALVRMDAPPPALDPLVASLLRDYLLIEQIVLEHSASLGRRCAGRHSLGPETPFAPTAVPISRDSERRFASGVPIDQLGMPAEVKQESSCSPLPAGERA